MTIENICCSRTFCLILTLLLLAIPFLDCQAQPAKEMDWDKFLDAWKTYLGYPSGENANRISGMLSDTGFIKFKETEKADSAISSVRWNLDFLAYEVYTGDTSAARLAFRLCSVADGAFAEELDVVLGRLIRINPLLFLRELKSSFRKFLRLDGLLGNTGSQYYAVQSEEGEMLEMSLRSDALKKVTDPGLIKIRDECIKVLEGELKK